MRSDVHELDPRTRRRARLPVHLDSNVRLGYPCPGLSLLSDSGGRAILAAIAGTLGRDDDLRHEWGRGTEHRHDRTGGYGEVRLWGVRQNARALAQPRHRH